MTISTCRSQRALRHTRFSIRLCSSGARTGSGRRPRDVGEACVVGCRARWRHNGYGMPPT
eukprot:5876649-Prymnesium_polylepis.1